MSFTQADKETLARIEQTLEVHTYLLAIALKKEDQMADTLDDVKADAEAQKTVAEGTKVVIDHAVSLLDEIGAKLANAGVDPVKLAEIRQLIGDNSASLSSEKDALAAAVERNTQSQPSGAA